MNNCRWCNKELEGSDKKAYCDEHCKDKWHYHNEPKVRRRVRMQSKARYERLKHTKAYKKMKRDNHKKWREANPRRWAALVAKAMKKYNAKEKSK